MGYRSDVKVLIDIPNRKAIDVAKEVDELTTNLGCHLFNKFFIDEKENILILETTDVKWYRGDDDIDAFEKWLSEMGDKFDNEKGGIHFIRIGENPDDVEEGIYGDPKDYIEFYRHTEKPQGYEFKEIKNI